MPFFQSLFLSVRKAIIVPAHKLGFLCHSLSHILLGSSRLRFQCHIDVNALLLEVHLQPFISALLPIATLFIPTERGLGVGGEGAVDAYCAGLKLTCNS